MSASSTIGAGRSTTIGPGDELDGIHDMGGKQGFGLVEREENEPAFHERWEARVFSFMAPTFASGACRNVDQFRHAIERIDPRAAPISEAPLAMRNVAAIVRGDGPEKVRSGG